MDIALTIAHMSQISIFKAASPVAITEALLCREFLGRDLVMAKDPKAPPTKREHVGTVPYFVKLKRVQLDSDCSASSKSPPFGGNV